MPIGDDNTYVNAIPPENAGSRNTVIGPGIINSNGPIAIGAGAMGGARIVINAEANAAAVAAQLLAQLEDVLRQSGHDDAAEQADELRAEVAKPEPDNRRISRLWSGIKVAATTNETITLAVRIAEAIGLAHGVHLPT